MFRLHERTRMFFCRTGFLILCLGPTLFLSAAAVHYRSPSYLEARREEWTAVLSDKLGLDVKIAKLSYPVWNTALLEELALVDPETGEEVLRTRYVEVTLEEGRWQIAAGQPEINAAALPQLVELVNSRLLKGQSLQLAPLHFAAGELTFRTADTAQTFQHVRGDLTTVESGKRAEVTFQVAGAGAQTPLQLTIERLRVHGAATTTCHLDASETVVPCGAFAPLAPWLKQLGSDATFRGKAKLEHAAESVKTDIRGVFNQVDLDELVSARFPQLKLSGSASIECERLELASGRIVELQGTLQSRGGTVSRLFLLAARNQLDLAPADDRPLPAEPLIRYSHLAFGFRLDEDGLSLSGDASPANQGAIMSSAKAGLLLVEPERPVVPVAYLVNVFSPRSELQIPATREAKSLLEFLPLPALLPLEKDSRPQANNIRLHKRK